ncbi:MAG: M42 family peptidase, partial [Oscillospiraceae bacterium]|nr:M42 family peptidase [Oscillospiraceae bacterium]
MDKLLKKLIPPVSASGHEAAIAKVIEELGKPYGSVARDALGNLVIHKPGNGRRVMVAAHMDTVGLIVTYLEDGGFARFVNLGGLRPIYIVGQRVRFDNGVFGVICHDS